MITRTATIVLLNLGDMLTTTQQKELALYIEIEEEKNTIITADEVMAYVKVVKRNQSKKINHEKNHIVRHPVGNRVSDAIC